MLPRQEILAWRPHAAWRTDAQVEQDLLLTRAMAAIFDDAFLREQVAMRGGTVLHKVHLPPAARYSEDIDLVAVGDRPPAHIRSALVRVLQPILGRPRTNVIESVRLAVRNVALPSALLRLVYVYTPTTDSPTAKLKVEVNVTERTPVFPTRVLGYDSQLPGRSGPIEVVSYDLDEMLATKMRALLQRDHGRDLFDLAHAWQLAGPQGPGVAGGHARIDPARVSQAFASYMGREGTSVSRSYYDAEVDRKLGLRRFAADLADVLASGVAYDIEQAAATFKAAYLPHLQA